MMSTLLCVIKPIVPRNIGGRTVVDKYPKNERVKVRACVRLINTRLIVLARDSRGPRKGSFFAGLAGRGGGK